MQQKKMAVDFDEEVKMSDLIRRQDAINALIEKGQESERYKLGEFWELNFKEIQEALATVQSAEPERKMPREDTISRQDAIDALDCSISITGRKNAETVLDLICAIRDRINASPSAEPRWIPVSERLPKVGETVIAQCSANIIETLKVDSDGDWYHEVGHCYPSGFVIAWKPLPEPYVEDDYE